MRMQINKTRLWSIFRSSKTRRFWAFFRPKCVKSFACFMNAFKTIRPLSNIDITSKCQELEIKHFKGVFMRDELKRNAAKSDECLILNIDESSNNGTHWTCLFIKKGICYYFDSFGFPPPSEVYQYCKKYTDRNYNTFRIQKPGEVICGHYCIYMLHRLSNGFKFYDVLDELYRYNNI